MERDYVSHIWRHVGDSHLDVSFSCDDGCVKTNVCFAAYFEDIIRPILHDVAKEDEQYVIIMPDYTVEEVSKITKGYSIVNSSNSSEVTKSRVKLSHHDHAYYSKSNVAVSSTNCDGHIDKFDSNDKETIKLNTNLNEVIKSKETIAKYEKICDICGKIFYNSLKFAKHKYSSHPSRNNNVLKCQNLNCLETFSNKHLLNLHLKRKHSNLTFECSQCGKSFKRSDVLLKHVQNVHNKH